MIADPRARKRGRRTDLAVKRAYYRLADEKREIILVACSAAPDCSRVGSQWDRCGVHYVEPIETDFARCVANPENRTGRGPADPRLCAEHERKMISERTKAALQAAKARGVRLGNPQLAWFAAGVIILRRVPPTSVRPGHAASSCSSRRPTRGKTPQSAKCSTA